MRPESRASARRPLRWALALALLLALSLTGCAQLTDIHDRSLIFGLGLDEGPAHGTVTVSAQAMHPSEGGGTPGGGGTTGGGGGAASSGWKTLVASGSTLSGALGQLQAETDREVFLGQLAILFIGEGLARQGALHDLDAMVRSPQVPENLPIVVAEGRAAAFLQAGTKQQVAWRVRSFVTKPRAGLAVLPNPLWHFVTQSLDLGRASYAPVFAGNPGGEALRLVGTGIFVAGRMVDVLPTKESTALAWMISRTNLGGVTLGSDGNEFHVAIHNVRARWNVSEPTSPLLQLNATGEVTASPGGTLASRPQAMQKEVAHEMEVQLLDVLHRLQADGADLLQIGERLRERGSLPPGPWSSHFADLRFRVRVKVHLVPGKVR